MPVQIKFEVDGGLSEFQRIINKGAESIRNFTTLWEYLIAYFEGRQSHAVAGVDPRQPVQEIYESEGAKIGADWAISPRYAEWKEEHWQDWRTYETPITRNSKQVLTGATLDSLLNSNSADAIRETSSNTLVYGSKVPWSGYNQESRRILDIYPEMDTGMGRVMRLWLHDYFPGLDQQGDK